MSLADYLAKKYLTADPDPPKKSKKRKRRPSESGLIIADDDNLGWENSGPKDADDDGPVTITGSTSDFRKSARSAWKTVGAPPPQDSDQAAADAIISATAAENALHTTDPSDEPTVMEMESGARAGLQTAGQVTAAVNRKRAAELSRFRGQGDEELGKGAETIYRDASGRVVNVAMKRAEARKKAEEEEAKKARETEAQKGDVQRAERERRKEKLEEAKLMTVARYADDEELNAELKNRERWNDPAAAFLKTKESGRSATGKPLYKGPAAPNRYAIRPGHRWDGVDRSNGFEKEYFAARNKRANIKELEYAWQMDE